MGVIETDTIKPQDLIIAYRLFQKMTRHPQIIEEMRRLFLIALEARGIADRENIESEALKRMAEQGDEIDEDLVKEYSNVIGDILFAKHFSEEEIENYINLARKNDRFRHLYRVVNREGVTSQKIKKALKEFCAIPQGDLFISPNEAEGVRVALINYFISNQLPFISVAKKHITIRDSDDMLDHTYFSSRRPGKIGGKAAGVLLAHKILLPRLAEADSDFEKYIKVPQSFYFNSGIFSDFLDYNRLHEFHTQKYKTREEIEEEYKNISKTFDRASFPPDVEETFREFLENIGERPLILRSSSLLEDNFGFAFSGKYDSVFLSNQGDLEIRLKDFIRGLKRVHMSTYGPSPILYRKAHKLLDFDERMSVLVQEVVGRRFGDFFFPFSAGVAFSYSSYSWTPRIKREVGVVRLVLGLGTRAVDRVGSDYPRMIPLSHPTLRSEIGAEQISKYSQKTVDILNLNSGQLESVPYIRLLNETNHPDLYFALSVKQDGHLAAPMFKTQKFEINRTCVTFDNFINKTPFINVIKKALRVLEEAYGQPVDVEFAWDAEKLYILQCRCLSIRREDEEINIPENISDQEMLFTNDQVMTTGALRDIEYIVYVDPKAYADLGTYEEKIGVGRVVNRLNRVLEEKRYALLGPGRWGSNDINLGVRVAYEDINHTMVLGEIAFEEGGSTPEVSHGTHFFNDLVEAHIVPIALFPDAEETVFKEEFLISTSNKLDSLAPEYKAYDPVVHVIHVPESSNGKYLHVFQDARSQKGIGFFGQPTKSNRRS